MSLTKLPDVISDPMVIQELSRSMRTQDSASAVPTVSSSLRRRIFEVLRPQANGDQDMW
jgi:hypothetical protein